MPYRLKPGQESFEIMGGPDEGKPFSRGKVYDAVPEGYADRFEEIKAEGGRLKTEGKKHSAISPQPSDPKKKAGPPVETQPLDVAETDNKETNI